MSRYIPIKALGAAAAALLLLMPARAFAQYEVVAPTPSVQVPPPANSKPTTTYFGSERFRIEDWNWFPTLKADGAYTFESSVLRLGVSRTSPTDEFTLEIEQASLIDIPRDAVGAGSVGTLGYGGNYFSANGNQSASLFPKQAYARFFRLGNNPSQSVRFGRFIFTDAAGVTPADPTLRYLKANRISDRLISESNFSTVGRSFDGFQYTSTTRMLNVNAVGASPTRGVYSLNGWDTLADIQIGYLAATFPQPGKRDAAESRLFAIYYGDDREQDTKVDNRPSSARAADTRGIHLGTFGGDYLRTLNLGPGRLDGVLWGASQIGAWGELTDAAYAYDGELGYQFDHVAMKPWFRLGYAFYSGDGNPGDKTHGTFIPLLTTSQKLSPIPFYTQANLRDFFGQVILRPPGKATVRAEIHGLKLANPNDLWYTGGGAYTEENFGYTGRPSGGLSNLGTLYALITEYPATAHLSILFSLGYARGGDVEAVTFPGRDADYCYLEFLSHF